MGPLMPASNGEWWMDGGDEVVENDVQKRWKLKANSTRWTERVEN